MSGSIRVEIDRDRCMGNAICVLWFEDLFTLDGEDKAVGPGVVSDSMRDRAFEAVQNCPAGAISMHEE